MVKVCSEAYLKRVAAAIFERCRAPAAEAALVADLLVQADLMGLHSHENS